MDAKWLGIVAALLFVSAIASASVYVGYSDRDMYFAYAYSNQPSYAYSYNVYPAYYAQPAGYTVSRYYDPYWTFAPDVYPVYSYNTYYPSYYRNDGYNYTSRYDYYYNRGLPSWIN